jgi:hypothetical protein
MMTPPAIVAPAVAPVACDLTRLLACIRACEEDKRHPIGKDGERSPWQLTQETWIDTTSLPWDDAFDTAKAYSVARTHLMLCKYELLRDHFEVSAYSLALCFIAGHKGYVNRKWLSPRRLDRAQRIANLYNDRTP